MKQLIGKTIVEVSKYSDRYGGQLLFICSDGSIYEMGHKQSCCEHVDLIDICGDMSDIVGHPILYADATSSPELVNPDRSHYDSSVSMWTFYNIATIKGCVTLRWLGESNGYYSMAVAFDEILTGDVLRLNERLTKSVRLA